MVRKADKEQQANGAKVRETIEQEQQTANSRGCLPRQGQEGVEGRTSKARENEEEEAGDGGGR